jgi:hypothetical protein
MTSKKPDSDLEIFEKKIKITIKYVMLYVLTFTALIFVIYGIIDIFASAFLYRFQGYTFIFVAYMLMVFALLLRLQLRKRERK